MKNNIDYYKEQQNGYPVVSTIEDDAKIFEYKEDAEIVCDLLNLYIKCNPNLKEQTYNVEAAYGRATSYNYLIKTK